jgi:hypothetical protein
VAVFLRFETVSEISCFGLIFHFSPHSLSLLLLHILPTARDEEVAGPRQNRVAAKAAKKPVISVCVRVLPGVE